MKKSTLRWGIAAAAIVLLLAAWLLLSSGALESGEVFPERRVRTSAALPAAPAPEAAPEPDVSASGGDVELIPAGSAPAAPAVPAAPARRVVIEGKVVGLGGEPVPGASVNLLLPPGHGEGPWVAQGVFIPDPGWPDSGSDDVFDLMRESTTAGEDGSFRIDAAARPSAGLIAWGGAYANTIVEPFSLEEDVRGLVLRMQPAVALSGRVMESAGPHLEGREPAPLADVQVSLLKSAPGGRWIHLRFEKSDAEGRFRTWGWTPGTYGVLARGMGLRTRLLPEIHLPSDGLDIRMRPADTAAVAGRVTLADGFTPAAGVRVRATTRQASGTILDDYGEGDTDAEGKFRIEGLEVGAGGSACWLLLDAEGGERGKASLSDRAWRPGTEPDLVLQLRPSRTLRVRAVDGSRAGGGPAVGVRLVARAVVTAPQGRGTGLEVERAFETGKDGSAEVDGLPGEHVRLAVQPDEWGWEFAERRRLEVRVPEAPAEGPWEEEVEVVPRGRIRGLVNAADGGPAAGVHVEVVGNFGDRSAASAAVTGADGRFTLQGVTSRRPVVVRARPFPGIWADSHLVSLEPGTTLEGIVIRLPFTVDSIGGRVVDEEGNPRPEVQVVARRESAGATNVGLQLVAWTGTGGRFRIDVPAGTEWKLRADEKGLASETIGPVGPGEAVPDLVLRPLAEAK